MESTLRAVLRLLSQIVMLLILTPPVLLCQRMGWNGPRAQMVRLFYRVNRFCWNINVKVEGEVPVHGPMLLVSNHCTYLDVIVLGSLLPVSFVAKEEIARWPVIGPLCKLCDVIFIERKANRTAHYRDVLRAKLEQRRIIGLFPEGTTDSGTRVLPFKSSFFNLAEEKIEEKAVPVQPVTIAYTHLNGLPIGVTWRPLVSWHGNMDAVPHMWRFLKLGGVQARVKFHEIVPAEQYPSRKEMAQHCGRLIAAQLEEYLHTSKP